jgi:hypothetical protein
LIAGGLPAVEADMHAVLLELRREAGGDAGEGEDDEDPPDDDDEEEPPYDDYEEPLYDDEDDEDS